MAIQNDLVNYISIKIYSMVILTKHPPSNMREPVEALFNIVAEKCFYLYMIKKKKIINNNSYVTRNLVVPL